MSRDFITIVSGLPRSGTSLMMQMLAAGGIAPLTDDLRPADESNARGYFEFDPVKRLRQDQSWLGQAAGRAVKIIHLLIRELPVDGRFQYRVLLMKRPLSEVLASQRVMLERNGKKSADEAALEKIFGSQLVQLNDWLARHDCFRTLEVDYRRIVQEPSERAREIATFLDGDLDEAAMAAVVDAQFYRQRGGG